MRCAKYAIVLLFQLLLVGCSTIAQQSAAVWGIMWFKEDPVPVYVSPMVYENHSCETLSSYHDLMGRFTNGMNQQMASRMRDIAVPENMKVSQLPDAAQYVRQHNLPIDLDATWYEAFVTGWGHYEAIHKAQRINQCGLVDPFGLLPWELAEFSW